MEALKNLSLLQKIIAFFLFLVFLLVHLFNFVREWFDFYTALYVLAALYLGLSTLHRRMISRGSQFARYLVPPLILIVCFMLSGLIFQLWVLAP